MLAGFAPDQWIRAERRIGELMDEPVERGSPSGVRVRVLDESECLGRIGQLQADCEAREVRERVAERGEFPVQEQSSGYPQEVADLQVVVKQSGLNINVHDVEFAVEDDCGSSEVWCRSRIGVQPVVEVATPGRVPSGPGKTASVGAGDAMDGGQGFGDFFQERLGGYGCGVDCCLRSPRRLCLRVGAQQPGSWDLVLDEKGQGGGFVGGAGRAAVVLQNVGDGRIDVPHAIGLPCRELLGAVRNTAVDCGHSGQATSPR